MSISNARARARMVASIRRRGIADRRVLQAMAEVPRHLFVPPEVRDWAYGPSALSIGEGQTISTPFIVASMTQLLELEGGERVLEIGTGCGYQTAILCRVSAEVFSMEINETVALMGRANLETQRFEAHLRHGDGAEGWPDFAPFDRILLAATAPRIPECLLAQLAPGGIALGPERVTRAEGQALTAAEPRVEVLAMYRRVGQALERSEIYKVRFVPMTGRVAEGIHGGAPT